MSHVESCSHSSAHCPEEGQPVCACNACRGERTPLGFLGFPHPALVHLGINETPMSSPPRRAVGPTPLSPTCSIIDCHSCLKGEIHRMFCKAGLHEKQNLVDHRLQVNRKKQIQMHRVWVQGKFQKPSSWTPRSGNEHSLPSRD